MLTILAVADVELLKCGGQTGAHTQKKGGTFEVIT